MGSGVTSRTSTGASGGQVPPSYALSEEAVVRVTDVSRTRVPLPPEAPDGLTGLAVSLDQRRAAAVERDRRELLPFPNRFDEYERAK